MSGYTADVLASTPADPALWELVDAGEVEMNPLQKGKPMTMENAEASKYSSRMDTKETCGATTESGERCSRPALASTGTCRQHRDDDARATEVYRASRNLRKQADELEGEAVRLALEVGGWLEGRACKVLGLSKTAFRHLVTKHGLRGQYDAARAAMGYKTGRVKGEQG